MFKCSKVFLSMGLLKTATNFYKGLGAVTTIIIKSAEDFLVTPHNHDNMHKILIDFQILILAPKVSRPVGFF